MREECTIDRGKWRKRDGGLFYHNITPFIALRLTQNLPRSPIQGGRDGLCAMVAVGQLVPTWPSSLQMGHECYGRRAPNILFSVYLSWLLSFLAFLLQQLYHYYLSGLSWRFGHLDLVSLTFLLLVDNTSPPMLLLIAWSLPPSIHS